MSEVARSETDERITRAGVIAIVRLDSSARLPAVAEAIRAGGVEAIEFALTTPGALDALRATKAALGDGAVLGAGTVLDAETARAAILAGARFIVSPTLSASVIRMCRRYGVVSIPGAFTPTEISTAWELGADFVKLFPAASIGPGFVKDILAPLPHVRLIPTGGITLENAALFIAAGAAAVAVGSSLVDPRAVNEEDDVSITATARAFCALVSTARRDARRQASSVASNPKSGPPMA